MTDHSLLCVNSVTHHLSLQLVEDQYIEWGKAYEKDGQLFIRHIATKMLYTFSKDNIIEGSNVLTFLTEYEETDVVFIRRNKVLAEAVCLRSEINGSFYNQKLNPAIITWLLLGKPDNYSYDNIYERIDWKNEKESYIKKIAPILRAIKSETQFRALTTRIAKAMLDNGMCFSELWWKALSPVLKIRCIFLWSNYQDVISKSKAAIERLIDVESNEFAVSMLLYCMIYCCTSKGKQVQFEKAHKRFLLAIANAEYVNNCVPVELQSIFGTVKQCDNMWEQTVNTCYKEQNLCDLLLNMQFTPLFSYKVLGNWKRNNGNKYVNKLFDFAEVLAKNQHRLICIRCRKKMVPNFTYTKHSEVCSLTLFSCEQSFYEPNCGHDQDVYINRCYHCQRMIDSRVCAVRQSDLKNRNKPNNTAPSRGYYICPVCGGGSKSILPGIYCPAKHKYNVPYKASDIFYDTKEKIIYCNACHHNGEKYQTLPDLRLLYPININNTI